MKEMYKDNAGNWHYGYKGEKLTEVSYSANSVPNSIPIEWLKKWAETNSNGEWSVEYRTVFNGILKDWENNEWPQ